MNTKKTNILMADELDKMLVEMCSPSFKWNYNLLKPYTAMVRMVCKELGDFELYHVLMKELILKKFWLVPNAVKWQPLSLMKEYLSNGNIMNEFGRNVVRKIPIKDLLKMTQECPDQKAKKIFIELQKYYPVV